MWNFTSSLGGNRSLGLRCLLQGIQTPGWSSRVKGITDVKISWWITRVLPGDHRVVSPPLQVALIQSGRSVVWNSIRLINTPQTVASDDKHLLSWIFSLDVCSVGAREAFLCIHVICLPPRSFSLFLVHDDRRCDRCVEFGKLSC